MPFVDQVKAQVERIIRNNLPAMERRLEELIREFDRAPEIHAQGRVELQVEYLNDLADMIDANNLQIIQQAIKPAVAKRIKQIAGSFGSAGMAEIAGVSEEALESLVRSVEENLLAVRGRAIANQAELIGSMILGQPPSTEAINALHNALGTAHVNDAMVIMDTNLMGIDRKVNIELGSRLGIGLFRYTGPMDSITRPFCQRTLRGRSKGQHKAVYTLADMEAMHNDTGPNPPSIFAGGYNCRHAWIPFGAQGG